MPSAAQVVAAVRDATCAIMRTVATPQRAKGNRPAQTRIDLAFVGTGWCIDPDRFVVTAHHVLNEAKPRNPNHRFYVFAVPGNGETACHFPVTGFALEDAENDLAILEIGPPAQAGHHLPSVPVTFTRPPDGSAVVTYGFPSPAIHGANVDEHGHFLGGGQFFLKGHANEGIVAAQYVMGGGAWQFEFNVGWHHGESGGPVVRTDPEPAVFAVMQSYRGIQAPHGIVVGPHQGRSLEVIRRQLHACNAQVVP